MHRVESDGSGVCLGVDGYIFPCALWDRLYLPDTPEMFCGGTHVDWWLSRLAQKHHAYQAVVCLRHLSHPKSAASAGADLYGEHNLREFAAWAERNEVSTAYEA